MTGVGDSKTGTFEDGIVAKDARDRNGVAGDDMEEESSPLLSLSGEDGWRSGVLGEFVACR